jgi:hypothetical protein
LPSTPLTNSLFMNLCGGGGGDYFQEIRVNNSQETPDSRESSILRRHRTEGDNVQAQSLPIGEVGGLNGCAERHGC